MPFTNPEDRIRALKGLIGAVGDLCFVEYKPMKEEWDKTRRWTTAHNQYKRVFGIRTDGQAAKELAWWVHFVLNVIPYEIEKRAENGDVGEEPSDGLPEHYNGC